jgi:hypothetical membrane protein
METGLLHLHNILRWVILIFLLLSIATAYNATNQSKKPIWLITLIAAHTTLLIGIYQVYQYFQRYQLAKEANPELSLMKDKAFRFFIIEHPILMVISIVLITAAYRQTKKAAYRKAAIFFIIALLAVLVAVPWPFRDVVGRNWFPGMS